MRRHASVCLLLMSSPAFADATGSGVLINADGDVLTAAHVVKKCTTVQVHLPFQPPTEANITAIDNQNDLALLRSKILNHSFASIRGGTSAHVGETVAAAGYPLSGFLSRDLNVTTGVISASAGLGDDVRYFQISAPVQPGNSGGPLLDTSGNIAGIVAAKLDFRVAAMTGALPENVNFAVKSDMAVIFLNSVGAHYRLVQSVRPSPTTALTEAARNFTVHIVCKSDSAPRAAATSKKQQKTNPASAEPWERKLHPDWFRH